MLDWAARSGIFCFLDNHHYSSNGLFSFGCLLAAGEKRKYQVTDNRALAGLEEFVREKPAWLFGHLGYDLKNEIENLTSSHEDLLRFPVVSFFEPAILLRLTATELTIEPEEEAKKIFLQIIQENAGQTVSPFPASILVKHRFSRDEYIATITKLKEHILRGDCYEINFCQEFYAEEVSADPFTLYDRLSRVSPNPFSALYKLQDKYLICASPERFLKKEGSRIFSQPIKGTASRNLKDALKDNQSRQALYSSKKDRSENVMVVDLVRNDLSRICEEGSVRVDELFGIYSFPQVHQMISTISGQLKKNIGFGEIIRATFPMGSMTGAPKKRVMELIEQYERSRRGLFSGALGYITPWGDFDFNVVIRSIMYNVTERYLSFMAGSGITFYSNAENEYEECLWKAQAMLKAVTG